MKGQRLNWKLIQKPLEKNSASQLFGISKSQNYSFCNADLIQETPAQAAAEGFRRRENLVGIFGWEKTAGVTPSYTPVNYIR